jgi:hypothetical protein
LNVALHVERVTAGSVENGGRTVDLSGESLERLLKHDDLGCWDVPLSPLDRVADTRQRFHSNNPCKTQARTSDV